MQNLIRILLTTLLLAASLSQSPPAAAAGPYRLPQVLVLHSYHQNYRWTEDITTGIQDVLSDRAELHFEYMDTKKHSEPAYLDAFARMLEMKAERIEYDLIISCDNYAFDFIRENRDRLYGSVPLVFCGVNFFDGSRTEGFSNVTGFSEEINFADGLDLIRNTFPARTKLVCVLDETLTAQATLIQLQKVLPDYEHAFESIELWSRVSMSELIRDLSLLDDRFVVYLIYFQRDRFGDYYEFHHSTKLIGEASGAPVFAAMDFQFSHGIIGGNLLRGVEQGGAAGRTALKILEGASVDSFPLYRESPHHVMFDYRAMKRYGLGLKDIPEQSIVINRPDTLFYRYRLQISVVLGVITILLAMVMILFSVVRKLRISKRRIDELNSSLNGKVARRTEELEFTNNSLLDTLEKLQKTQSELIRNERLSAIGSLVSGVAQEINTPLGAGMATVSSMGSELRDMERDMENQILTQDDFNGYLSAQKKGLSLVEASLNKTAALISSFRHLSLDERGGDCVEFDLNDFLEGILMTHNNQFSERRITVSLTGNRLHVLSYPGSFYQIINHLLKNSLVYGFDDGWAENQVDIRLSRADELTGLLEYSDNGRGIPEDMAEHIFEPFTTTGRERGNSGLGLYVIYKTVHEKLRGAVEYRPFDPSSSRPGVRFRIYFLLKDETKA